MNTQKLGEFLEAKRISENLTLRQFCLSKKVDAVMISKMERNRYYFTDKDVKFCAELYNCDVEELKNLDISYAPDLTDEELVQKLPVFLNKDLTEKQLNQIIEVIRKA